jgi:hypothetical protein
MATKLSGVLKREVSILRYVKPDGEEVRDYYTLSLTADGVMLRKKGERLLVGPLAYDYLHTHGAVKAVNSQRETRKRHIKRSVI